MWDLRVFPQDDSVSPGNLFETVMTDHPAILLLRCVLDQDLDRALTLGLMEYVPALGDAMLDPRYPDLPAQLLAAQRRLRPGLGCTRSLPCACCPVTTCCRCT